MTHETNYRPGLAIALIVLCVYGGLALGVDFPRAALGFQSDEATYYMMGHSFALDGDVTYRAEDLRRVWREFPSGPTGVFLKRGRDIVQWGLMLKPPFIWTRTVVDSQASSRLFFGKAFIYPLFAAPFVRMFGTNGFLVLHALLLALVVWCGYLFLHTRMPAAIAALFSAGFVMVSVVPVYFVWIAPELFNFCVGLIAYVCWLYKEAAPPDQVPPRGMRWLSRPSSDIVASMLCGILTFSKVTNALLFPPVAIWLLWRREWRRAVMTTLAFGAVSAGLFAINVAISGEWNYQGGEERRTFVHEYAFQTEKSGFEVGTEKERNEALTNIIFDRRVFVPNLVHNVSYYFVGRFSGLFQYFFPAVFALALFLATIRRRPAWQHLVIAAGLAQMFVFVVGTPYTWNGGGGSVGNRYFMSAYGLYLFVLPVTTRLWVAVLPWIVGSIFVAPLVLNPFYASFYPGSYAKHGPLRLFPVELTLVYDWPINTDESRVRKWFGDHEGRGDPGFQIYFFDDNAYLPEGDKTFWVKGASRSEFLIKTDRPMKQAIITVTAGQVATEVDVNVAGRSQHLSLRGGEQQRLVFTLPPGFMYQATWPVWTASVASSQGFVPIFYEAETTDTRFLGVRVDPVLVP